MGLCMSAVRVEESKEGAVNAGIQPRTHRPSDRTAFRILHDGVPRAENRLHRIHRGCISARRLFQSSAHYTEPHDTRNITSPNANITSSTATCSCTVTTARRCLRHQPHRVAMRPTYWRTNEITTPRQYGSRGVTKYSEKTVFSTIILFLHRLRCGGTAQHAASLCIFHYT